MESIARITNAGVVDYFLKSAIEAYYTQEEQSPGYWSGKGAALLGLEGGVTRETFQNLLHGFSPDGKKKLVQNAGSPNRQVGWDLTSSAPKAFSAFCEISPHKWRPMFDSIQKRAGQEAADFIESVAGWSRCGKGGHTLEKASLVFANFPHCTSRANDPAVHTHKLLFNIGIRPDGTTGALWSNDIYRHKMAAGKVYRDALARLLQEELGLVIEPRKIGFHIQGVPQDLCDIFSKRRAQILKSLAEKGLTSAVAAKIATLDTRPDKKNVPLNELREYWTRVGEEFGFGRAQAEVLLLAGQERLEKSKTYVHAPEERLSKDEGNKSPGWKHSKQQNENSRSSKSQAGKAGHEDQRRNKRGHATGAEWPKQTSPHAERSANGKSKTFLQIKKQLLFPHAPEWSPFKYLKASHIEANAGKEFRRWGKINWSKKLSLAQIRIQQKYIFPNASPLNPLHNATLPSLRILSPSQQRKMSAMKAHFQKVQERMSH